MDIDELTRLVRESRDHRWKRRKKSNTFTVADIAHKVADETNVRYGTAKVVLEAAFPIIKKAVDDGFNVAIKDFGEYQLKERRARLFDDFAHPGKIFIPPKFIMRFLPNATWKWTQYARYCNLPEDFRLPDGVHFPTRLTAIFRNHNMFGLHREEGETEVREEDIDEEEEEDDEFEQSENEN